MSEAKKQLTEDQITYLRQHEDKLTKAIEGKSIALNSIVERRLGQIHFDIFGVRQSMSQCCGGMRTTASRLTPLANTYFEQVAKEKADAEAKKEAAKKAREQKKKK